MGQLNWTNQSDGWYPEEEISQGEDEQTAEGSGEERAEEEHGASLRVQCRQTEAHEHH